MHPLARRLPPTAFGMRDGMLHVEGVALADIARTVGTPVYVYSARRIRERYGALAAALAPLGVEIHYALKANGNRAVVALLAELGAGADIVSGGELKRALAAGMPPGRIVFSGVGKTGTEIATALDAGIHQINVESLEELELVGRLAAERGKPAPVALRVNPDVDAETHAKISTGRRADKFGIALDRVLALAEKGNLARGGSVALVGLAVHIGSQILKQAPFRAAYGRLADAVRRLRGHGLDIARLDLGGGFGVAYADERDFSPQDLVAVLTETVGDLGCRLSIEPGRTLVADAGVLLSRVALVKSSDETRFLILDAGMNDLVRPAMYDAHHDVVPVRELQSDEPLLDYDVAGPVCESSDVFGRGRPLPPMRAGDLVVLATAGAYGAAMSSAYNGRALAPEVLVDGSRFHVVRRRIGIEEQLSWEASG